MFFDISYVLGAIVDGDRLRMWFTSQRTAYGKITRTVSGSAPKVLTARESTLKDKLSFLAPCVYRVPKRAGVDVSIPRLTDRQTHSLTD